MTLTKTRMSPKQFKEVQLLASIRFACLMAMKHPNPMDSQRVQKRLDELNHYLLYNQPTPAFFNKHCAGVGMLGMEFVLGVCRKTQKAAVFRLSQLTPEQKQQVAA